VNNHDQKRYVIAISGASGTGKSTLVKALVQTLGDAVPLYFDDYNPHSVATSHYPLDLVKWVADGADPNAWETPQLALDLRSLRRGEPIKLPGKGGVLLPKRVLVLEDPFGRERTGMKDVIDFVIAIDAPLEIALARRLLRIAERPDFLDRRHHDCCVTDVP
jgi:uridine kinase